MCKAIKRKFMQNLVIGNTSQLSYYFPDDYLKVSSRGVSPFLLYKRYDTVFLSFGLNIKGLSKTAYDTVNVDYTLELVRKFSPVAKRVVVYATCELWSFYDRGVTLEDKFKFHSDPYIYSKFNLVNEIKKEGFENVLIMYPFNFNSIYRKMDSLFGKVFHSIKNKEKINTGSIDFDRDICTPELVVRESILANKDKMIGSGRLVNVGEFIAMLYSAFGLDYLDFITTDSSKFKFIPHKKYFCKTSEKMKAGELFSSTVNELKKWV